MRSEIQTEGQLEGSEGLLEGSEGQLVGSEGQLVGSEGQPRGDGRTDGRTNGRKISPFYRTSSPTGTAAQKERQDYIDYIGRSPLNVAYWSRGRPFPLGS